MPLNIALLAVSDNTNNDKENTGMILAEKISELKHNILENKLTNNIFSYSIALDENSGISHLHIHDDMAGAALATVSNENLSNVLPPLIIWDGTSKWVPV